MVAAVPAPARASARPGQAGEAARRPEQRRSEHRQVERVEGVRLEGRVVSAAKLVARWVRPRRERPDAACGERRASIPPSSISTAALAGYAVAAERPGRQDHEVLGTRQRDGRGGDAHLLDRELTRSITIELPGAKSTATRAEATTGTGACGSVGSASPAVAVRPACRRVRRCIAPRPRRPRWCRSQLMKVA